METTYEYTATATREGRWWIIRVPELGAVTQARNIREIDEMARGLIAALLDLPEDGVRVSVTAELPEPAASEWREAALLQAEADAAAGRAAVLRRSAVRALLSGAGLTQQEAGRLLGISYQRVQQFAKAG